MLHTVTRSPFQSQSLLQCLQYLSPEDEILLIEDAVVAGLRENNYLTKIKKSGVKIYLLKADIDARGLKNKCDNYFEIIDYKGFVSLTVKHKQQMKWG